MTKRSMAAGRSRVARAITRASGSLIIIAGILCMPTQFILSCARSLMTPSGTQSQMTLVH
jgi:hypothetical protein